MTVTRKICLALVASLVCAVAVIGFDVWHQGYRVYVIHTGSMVPTLPVGSVVFDKPAPAFNSLKPGEIITFRHSGLSTDVVTHRIVSLKNDTIQTKGDANATPDAWNIRPDQVEGATFLTVPKLGFLLIFMKQPAGVAAVVTAVFAMMLLWGLFFPAAADNVVRRIPAHRRSKQRREGAPIRASIVGHEELDPITELIPRIGDEPQHHVAPLSVSVLAAGVDTETDGANIAALNDMLEPSLPPLMVDA